mmetsp:Transcript_15146/g.33871  ORF Transcript_15146/g.33871 Transcript_15146/m.33871 type:complete len:343 (+) Transcript_15146:331-1359(+)
MPRIPSRLRRGHPAHKARGAPSAPQPRALQRHRRHSDAGKQQHRDRDDRLHRHGGDGYDRHAVDGGGVPRPGGVARRARRRGGAEPPDQDGVPDVRHRRRLVRRPADRVQRGAGEPRDEQRVRRKRGPEQHDRKDDPRDRHLPGLFRPGPAEDGPAAPGHRAVLPELQRQLQHRQVRRGPGLLPERGHPDRRRDHEPAVRPGGDARHDGHDRPDHRGLRVVGVGHLGPARPQGDPGRRLYRGRVDGVEGPQRPHVHLRPVVRGAAHLLRVRDGLGRVRLSVFRTGGHGCRFLYGNGIRAVSRRDGGQPPESERRAEKRRAPVQHDILLRPGLRDSQSDHLFR